MKKITKRLSSEVFRSISRLPGGIVRIIDSLGPRTKGFLAGPCQTSHVYPPTDTILLIQVAYQIYYTSRETEENLINTVRRKNSKTIYIALSVIKFARIGNKGSEILGERLRFRNLMFRSRCKGLRIMSHCPRYCTRRILFPAEPLFFLPFVDLSLSRIVDTCLFVTVIITRGQ